MRHYEVTFIVDPVLSGDEIKATAQAYIDLIKGEGSEIVHFDEMGLHQLAYPINKRSSGVYFCIEFSSASGSIIALLDLALRRDERIMRFLPVTLDKFGVKYNADKRAGLIGKARRKSEETVKAAEPAPAAAAPRAPVVEAAPVVAATAPVVEAPVINEEEE